MKFPKFTTILTQWAFWAAVVFILSLYSGLRVHYIASSDINPTLPLYLSAGLVHLDSYHYLHIAQFGYTATPTTDPAFYPLYPTLIALVHAITTISLVHAALLVSAICSLGATIILYLLTLELVGDTKLAERTALLFLFFPTAFYVLSAYSEALFCFLAFLAFYLARKKLWLPMAVCLALVTATRSLGFAVVIGCGVEYLLSMRENGKKIDSSAAYFLLAPLGFICYALYLYHALGRPFAMFEAYNYGWPYIHFNLNIFSTLGKEFILLGQLGIQRWNETFFIRLFDLLAWLGPLVVVFLQRKRLPTSFIAYVLASLLIMISTSSTVSFTRYALPLFPFYIGLVLCLNKGERYSLWLAISAVMMGIFLLLFSNGYWVA